MILINLGIVFLIGFFWGFTELLQRYRETKYSFLKKTIIWSLSYMTINGFASVLALFLIKYFRGQDVLVFETLEISNIIIAGLAGMMVLRSSIFSAKHNDKQIDIGFAPIVQTFLNVVERNMKNSAAASRVARIHEIMEDIDFESAKIELPSLCIEFIDNFTEQDSKDLKKKIQEIANIDICNINKSMQLGRQIAYYCDQEILEEAIKKLPQIKKQKGSNESDTDEFEFKKAKLKS